ncbi:lipase family protein [Shewanella sp. SR44-3]|uniref:lipase family protein n=1 Tax=Shewanella sp. SR44-3 TaxID=2760936 RepID=UPI0015F98936|nr:lipase family protein [Shewanella sp. SR44-3]MBB1270911.1 lipase family protein [Shewanella sp. SR44-3]
MTNVKREVNESEILSYEHYAILCDAVYRPLFNQKLSGYEHQKIIKNRKGASILRVLSNDKEVGIFFRGTNVLSDWFINLNIKPQITMINGKKIYVHSGFLKALNQYPKEQEEYNLFEILEKTLVEFEASKKAIVLAGHSLGGALAVLSAARLQDKYQNNISNVITFGQPAVGFVGFKKSYLLDNETIRVNSGLDIVTFLPGPFYKHVGRQIWIHNDEVFENVHWFRRIIKILKHAFTAFIYDHKMEKYIRHKTLFLKSNLLKNKNG